jgi:hypothetical protein
MMAIFFWRGIHMLIRLLVLILFVSCSTSKPTPYQHEKKKEGYHDGDFEELKVASFKANSYTKKEIAERYAEFRAIEKCRETDKKHANIIDIYDKTVEKTVTRTTGTNWGPSYGYGMYPYYSRYSSVGFGVGYSTVSGTSWDEKLVYPIMEVYYNCSDKIYRPLIIMKEISAEQMKLLVKDLKGGLQVQKIEEKSPNLKKIELGDIILKANGKRIERVYELIRLFDGKDSVVTLSILREGRPLMTKITANDVTADVETKEQEIIQKVCHDKKDEDQKVLKSRKICE